MKPEKVEIVLAERPEPTLSVHRVSLYFWLLYYWACSHTLLFPDVAHQCHHHHLSTHLPGTAFSSLHHPPLQLSQGPHLSHSSKVARFTSTYGLCPTFPSFTAAPQVVGECLRLPCKLWTTVATYLQPKQLKGVFSVALYISLGPILCKTVSNLQQPLANQ